MARSSDGARRSELLRDVIAGLSRDQKELPPKYFYDKRGSQLFEEITRLPEYYPTRTEAQLLRTFGAAWLRTTHADALVELGAGNAEKTRILLNALSPGDTYMPVDISREFLEAESRELATEYPQLRIRPVVCDITHKLDMPDDLPAPAVFAFLGSTIGNFENDAAVKLLRNIVSVMRHGDRFLMGADLKKDRTVLEAAYNDGQGITAEFNLNVLRVLNRELGADFDIDSFRHRATYNEAAGRIEMYLESSVQQTVTIPGWRQVQFAAGESIRTEVSTKYDEAAVCSLFTSAGLTLEVWQTDERGWYALAVGRM